MSVGEPRLSWWEPRWSHRRKLAELADALPSLGGWLRILAAVAVVVAAGAWAANRWLPEMEWGWSRTVPLGFVWAIALPILFYGLALVPPHVSISPRGLTTAWAIAITDHPFDQARTVVLDLSDPARRALGLRYHGRTVWVGIADRVASQALEQALRAWCPGQLEVIAEHSPVPD